MSNKRKHISEYAQEYAEIENIAGPEAAVLRLTMIKWLETEQLFLELMVSDEAKRHSTMDLMSQMLVHAKYHPSDALPEDRKIVYNAELISKLTTEGSIEEREGAIFFVADGQTIGRFNDPETASKLTVVK